MATVISFAGGFAAFGKTYRDNILRFQLSNRRYIGCKQKLLDWIFAKISEIAPGAKSFFDVFSGTGVVAQEALKHYKRVIVNDLLYSNQVIYEGFFAAGEVDVTKLEKIVRYYNSIDPDDIPENYFSENYGGKYFEESLAKIIGHIREDIDLKGKELTVKERSILLASLLYSIDSHANTCGHFDAYIKKQIPFKHFTFGLIEYESIPEVEIFRKDSNVLATEVTADVAYIDPPYNSRQYSRFYHVYETLIKWDKPELHGVARKPSPENMSEYCRTGALTVFEDLIKKLDCKYLFVSYNNTYASKSKSSENKITLEEIDSALKKIGKTEVFTHKHAFFNAGKTNFDDHKEYLFVTRKDIKPSFYRSPFFYVGDKYKLLPSILPNFPNKIKQFVEPFVGGGSVMLNVMAEKYLMNDIDSNMIALHKHLCTQSIRSSEWFDEIGAMIESYNLSRSYKEDIVPDVLKKEFVKTYFAKFNKNSYCRLRADYNNSSREGKEDLDRLYLLLIYGFNRMLRYNAKGDFNLPVGNVDFNSNVKEALEGYFNVVSKRNIEFYNMRFEDFFGRITLSKNDFVYLDPPYLITESEYNKIWKESDDERLMKLLDELNVNGIPFAISNVTHYRGRVNEQFMEWSRKYKTISIKSNYINYHDNSEKYIKEVLVVNYEKA